VCLCVGEGGGGRERENNIPWYGVALVRLIASGSSETTMRLGNTTLHTKSDQHRSGGRSGGAKNGIHSLRREKGARKLGGGNVPLEVVPHPTPLDTLQSLEVVWQRELLPMVVTVWPGPTVIGGSLAQITIGLLAFHAA
jgi:hypothetical protein